MDALFEGIENFIKNYFGWILLVFVLFFLLATDLFQELIPLVGTAILGYLAFKVWLHYVQQDFISGIEFVLLEIVPPRDVLRSPKAMELFITNALYHWSEKGGKEEYWQGAVWFWFSLEIASIEGQVHFYVRTPSRLRSLIETQMYAQYPQAQVKVVEDYTLAVDEISPESAWNGWGCEFKLVKPEAFPLKTYIDYGLDKDPKEEYKVDPISPVIELFGSLGKGEQAWVQILVTPSKRMYRIKGTWFGKRDWVEEAKIQIKKMLEPYATTRFWAGSTTKTGMEYRIPGFLDTLSKAMSAKTTKLGFETGIRLMYVAKKEAFSMNSRRNIRLIFRQYARPDSNELFRINSAQADRYSGIFPASQKTIMMLANRMLHEYRERAFFHLPLRHHIFSQHYWNWPFPNVFTFSGVIKAYVHHQTYVLNTEELATLWHLPGQILKVPTFERIESKEASPPTNLPT